MNNTVNAAPIDWSDLDQLPKPVDTGTPGDADALNDQRMLAAIAREASWEYVRQRARLEAQEKLAKETLERARRESGNQDRVRHGGSWLLDAPEDTPGRPLWSCAACSKLTLGSGTAEPKSCLGCGAEGDLGPVLSETSAACRSWTKNYGGQYDDPCLIAGSDGCDCPEGIR